MVYSRCGNILKATFSCGENTVGSETHPMVLRVRRRWYIPAGGHAGMQAAQTHGDEQLFLIIKSVGYMNISVRRIGSPDKSEIVCVLRSISSTSIGYPNRKIKFPISDKKASLPVRRGCRLLINAGRVCNKLTDVGLVWSRLALQPSGFR